MARSDDPGTRFPFINLQKAISRAEQLFRADPQGRPMAVPTVYDVWGYSSKSSGGHQTVGALKAYGLINDSGSLAERKLHLTDRAKRYFLEEREEQRAALLKDFALTPKLLAAVWAEWHGSPPADNIARSYLKLDRKLNEQSARSFLGIYKDNLAFANLKGSGTPFDQNPEAEDTVMEAQTMERERPTASQGPTVGPPPPKVSIDGELLTINASVNLADLPALIKKIEALAAFYKA
ncbi:MAG TPA: hypothetical protein VK472_07300 [Allosphingosinicella sp.]|nr:hypothetical protein [Allosphingosinicella sp.]